MDDTMRRTLLRSIAGSTIATGAFAGSAAASNSSDEKPGLGFDIEKQEVSVRDNQIGSVWSADPVKEVKKFLRKEHDIKIVPNDLDTYLVKRSNEQGEQNEFHLYRTPLSDETDLEADLVIRDHEDGAPHLRYCGNRSI
nr:hypothetical protein [Haloferax larsenii]